MRKPMVFLAGLVAGLALAFSLTPISERLGPDVTFAQHSPGGAGWEYPIWEHKPIRRHPDLVGATFDSLGTNGWQLVQVMPEIDQSVFVRMLRR